MTLPAESAIEIEELQDINPQVAEIIIGVRNLRKVKLFPLSVGDQLKMTDIFAKAIVSFLQGKRRPSDEELIGFFMDQINKNITKFLGLAIGERPDEKGHYVVSENLISDITNSQLSDIINKVFEMNFEDFIKNLKDLSEKVKKLFPSERSLPGSVRDTVIDFATSSQRPSEKEDSPADK